MSTFLFVFVWSVCTNTQGIFNVSYWTGKITVSGLLFFNQSHIALFM